LIGSSLSNFGLWGLGVGAALAIIRTMQIDMRKLGVVMILMSTSLMLPGCRSAVEETPTVSWTPIPGLISTSSSAILDEQGKAPTPEICLNNAFFLEDL